MEEDRLKIEGIFIRNIKPPTLYVAKDLVAYTDVRVETLGQAWISVKAFKQNLKLPVHVIKQEDIPLFGLNWCLAFNLPMPEGIRICHVQQNKKIENSDFKPNNNGT